MGKVKLTVKGLSYSQTQTGAYALILGEEGGGRSLPIIIGAFEAQSIAIALERSIDPPRPLTHDLFASFTRAFSIRIIEVYIHDLREGVFHANLLCEDTHGKSVALDARTSDAVALAARLDCPIYTDRSILDKAGVMMDEYSGFSGTPPEESEEEEDELENAPVEKPHGWSHESVERIKELLDAAVSNEDYELAARLRDELDRRENP
ncbi:hypothetical protein GC167_07475 [bacterium]|nr:hypothetical protein [bacterium]